MPADASAPDETYSYLGPAGTFTEAALAQVVAAQGKTWRPVNNVGEALDDVVHGRSIAAMIAIENSIEGGAPPKTRSPPSPTCESSASTSSR
jgi:prephenate dehydratase